MATKYTKSFQEYIQQWEEAAANSVGGGGVSLPSDAVFDKQTGKKKKVLKRYDGRTKEAKEFLNRILARRAARESRKKNN